MEGSRPGSDGQLHRLAQEESGAADELLVDAPDVVSQVQSLIDGPYLLPLVEERDGESILCQESLGALQSRLVDGERSPGLPERGANSILESLPGRLRRCGGDHRGFGCRGSAGNIASGDPTA